MDEFEMLFAKYRTVVERFVKFRLPSVADAEDVLQEVAMTACRKFEQLKNKEAFLAWLMGIARNKCNDYFRGKAKELEIPLDEVAEKELSYGRLGITEVETVRETLSNLADKDKQILYLYFWKELPQAEIAKMLQIPLGTVKSRLYTAKQNFKKQYPYHTSRGKGENKMKTLPNYLPEYTITKSDKVPFTVKHEELPGMFIIPRIGEKRAFALYDLPERKCTGIYRLSVKGNVVIHDVQGVEIESEYTEKQSTERKTIFAQLTDTHCRYLGGMHTDDTGMLRIVTFLDAQFADSYEVGEDNCGFPTERTEQKLFTETENGLVVDLTEDVSDICGRFLVKIGQKTYDTVRILDIQTVSLGTMLCEYYVDQNGHTVLWRRFNKNDWAFGRYQKEWTEILPNNERMTINGETYVHWYDCITDYVI
ncbi:MAG: sigma-70 family RNA polymerase sigma factor [Lachnospiraceae bacterium]|nr:sigma-70 family RNA polymerase sigma factor [Lachnospiraceae bacterium]